jgi:hypothetical protein
LFESDVLANALQHLFGAGFHTDEQPSQPGLPAARPGFLRQAHALVGTHGRSPGKPRSIGYELVRHRRNAITPREERLVLEIDVINTVAFP